MPDTAGRRARGARNHAAGLAAENQVRVYYEKLDYVYLATRWRGKSGELDLVLRSNDMVVFVEVKSSRHFGSAAQMVTERKLQRVLSAAQEYLGHCPKGELTPARVDIACVDQSGRIEIIENAICH